MSAANRFEAGSAFALWCMYPQELEDLLYEESWVYEKLHALDPELAETASEEVTSQVTEDWNRLCRRLKPELKACLQHLGKTKLHRPSSRRELGLHRDHWELGLTVQAGVEARAQIQPWTWFKGGKRTAAAMLPRFEGLDPVLAEQPEFVAGCLLLGAPIPIRPSSPAPFDLSAEFEETFRRLRLVTLDMLV